MKNLARGMKLSLKNFKCHENIKLSFPEKGLVLVHGESGIGKTSILNAIVYAMFGVCKRPCRFGKKGCQVTLEYRNLKIIRKHGPKSLVVYKDNTKYESSEAQDIISCCFKGNTLTQSEFMASSYIVQRNVNSLLSLTPSRQLEFIEKIAFDPTESKTIHTLICSSLSETKVSVAKIQEKYSCTMKMLEGLQKKNKKAQYIGIEIDIEEGKEEILQKRQIVEDLITKQKEQYKNVQVKAEIEAKKVVLIEKLAILEKKQALPAPPNIITREYLEKLKKELKNAEDSMRYASYADQKVKMEQELLELYDKKKMLEQELEVCKCTKDINQLNKENIELEHSFKKQIELRKKYKEKQSECVEYSEKIKELSRGVKDLLGSKFTSYAEYNEKIKEKLMEIESGNLECPECKTILKLEDGILSKTEKIEYADMSRELVIEVLKQLITLTQSVGNNRGWIEENYVSGMLRKVSNQYDKNTQELKECTILIEKAGGIQCEIRACTLAIHKLIEDIKTQSKKLPENFVCETIDVDELRERVANKTKEYVLSVEYKRKQGECEEKIKQTRSLLEMLRERVVDENVYDFTDEIRATTQEVERINNNILYTKERMEIKQNEKDEKELMLECKKIKAEKEQKENLLAGLYELQNVHKEAKLLNIQRCVSNVNKAAKLYLDEMFQEEDISVTLSCDMIEKKLDTNVIYKTFEYPVFEDLSGGEKQRIEFAFCLGLGDLFGSDLLLLDECMNNLQPDFNIFMFRYLQKLGKNKLIIVASHECIQGTFDHVVNIG